MSEETHTDSNELAAFQAALLDILSRFEDPEEIRRELAALDVSDEYRDWMSSFDPAMTEVAALLTKKWGVRIPRA